MLDTFFVDLLAACCKVSPSRHRVAQHRLCASTEAPAPLSTLSFSTEGLKELSVGLGFSTSSVFSLSALSCCGCC
eukprot:1870329-Amphidinium_carterae.1